MPWQWFRGTWSRESRSEGAIFPRWRGWILGVFALLGVASAPAEDKVQLNFTTSPVAKAGVGDDPAKVVQTVQVLRNGAPVAGLGARDFEVMVGGNRTSHTVTPSFTQRGENFGLLLVIDRGGQQTSAQWERTKAVAKALIGSRSVNAVAIYGADGQGRSIPMSANMNSLDASLDQWRWSRTDRSTLISSIRQAANVPIPSRFANYYVPVVVLTWANPTGAMPTGISRPVVMVKFGDTASPLLTEIAAKSLDDGAIGRANEPIQVRPNSPIDSIADAILLQSKKVVTDQYSVSFDVDEATVPSFTIRFREGSETRAENSYTADSSAQLMIWSGVVVILLGGIAVWVVRSTQRKAPPRSTPGRNAASVSPVPPVVNAPRAPDSFIKSAPSASPPPSAPPIVPARGMSPGFHESPTVAEAEDATEAEDADTTVAESSQGAVGSHLAPPLLRIVSGGLGQVQGPRELGRGMYVIGRAKTGDSPLKVRIEGDPQVSARHASLTIEQSSGHMFVRLEHLSQTNATYVNDQPLTGVMTLKPHDEIRVGQTRLRVVPLQVDAEEDATK